MFTNKKRGGIDTFVCAVSLYVAETPKSSIKDHEFCPSAVVPALQSIWFYNTKSDVWYEHFLIKRSGNNKPS